jgi:hypothetical protein
MARNIPIFMKKEPKGLITGVVKLGNKQRSHEPKSLSVSGGFYNPQDLGRSQWRRE